MKKHEVVGACRLHCKEEKLMQFYPLFCMGIKFDLLS
jgi:hypothetical protein